MVLKSERTTGVTTTKYPYDPSQTHHMAIFDVSGCFLPVWRPLQAPNKKLLGILFDQSKGNVLPVIFHHVPNCLTSYFRR